MTIRPSNLRDEQGAAASALLVTAMLMALGAFMYIALPFGNAADAKAGSQTAADAAALAGAEGVKDDLLQAVAANGWQGGSWHDEIPAGSGLGLSSAASLASSNHGTLTAYSFNVLAGEASVTVDGRSIDSEAATSQSVAQLEFPTCQAPPPPTGQPPVFDQDQVWCDGFWLEFVPVDVNGVIRYELTGQAQGLLDDAMEVRLVG